MTPAEVVHSASWEATAPALSVVVSTFSRAHYLPGFFAALEAQDLGSNRFEVVVVDDASRDDTWSVLRDLVAASPLAICAARLPENSGPATGRNVAVELARAELLAFTDDDCLAEPQWAREMLAALEAGGRLVQGRTEPEAGVPRGTWDHTIAVRSAGVFYETCNIGYRRDDVRAVGGFRTLPGYRNGRGGSPMGGEDTLMGWDVLRATGQPPEFAGEAVVHHRIEPRSVRGWLHLRNGMAIFPALVADVPELRGSFFHRWFFSARSAAFDLAIVGLLAAAALLSLVPLAALVPYAVMLAPRRVRGLRRWAANLPVYVAGDAATAWSLLRGSVRYRRLLL